MNENENELRRAIFNRLLNPDASGILLERLSQPRLLRLAEEFEKECEGLLVEIVPYLETALKVCSHAPAIDFVEEQEEGAEEPTADELEDPAAEAEDPEDRPAERENEEGLD